jgi:Holliday junction DNA helicase RuvA
VLELKEKIGAPTGSGAGPVPVSRAGEDSWRDQVRAGLLGLGWSTKEAEGAVESVAPEAETAIADGQPVVVGELLRSALRSLSKA